jgi:ferrochelatase
VLVVAFGGPEGPEEVQPFLDNVFRGLDVGASIKARVARRYEALGGISPLNRHTRQFVSALQGAIDAHGLALRVYWGNRNWHPLLPDALRQMAGDRVHRALVYVTSVFGSYSSCRQYRENLHEAARELLDPPQLDRLRLGFNHPGFIQAQRERVGEALAAIPEARRRSTPVLFTAHSLPESMARHSAYEAQLRECCQLVGEALDHERWRLVYQSRNAPYGGEAWLGPDVGEALREVRGHGAADVVVAPVGFVCDHAEVLLDLDLDAAATARDLGLNMIRAGTVGTHPAYVGMVLELIRERLTEDGVRRALGTFGPGHDQCPADCCLSGRPGAPKPALCGDAATESEHGRARWP